MQSADTYKKVEDRSSGSFDKLSDKLKVLREKESEFQKKVEKDFDSKQKKAPAAPTPAPAPPVFQLPKKEEPEATSSTVAKPQAKAVTPAPSPKAAPKAAPKPELVPASSLYDKPAPTPNKGGEIFTAGLAAAVTAAFFAKRSEGIQGKLDSDGPTLAQKIESWQAEKFNPDAFDEKWTAKAPPAPAPTPESAPVVEEPAAASEPAPAAEPDAAPTEEVAEAVVDAVEAPPVQARTSAAEKKTDKYGV